MSEVPLYQDGGGEWRAQAGRPARQALYHHDDKVDSDQ